MGEIMQAKLRRLGVVMLSLFAVGHAVQAQSQTQAPDADAWIISSDGPGLTMIIHQSERALVYEWRGFDQDTSNRFITEVIGASPCGAILPGEGTPIENGRARQHVGSQGTMVCSMILMPQSDGRFDLSLAIDRTDAPLGADALQAERLGLGLSGARAKPVLSRPGESRGLAIGDDAVRAVMAAVPQSNRPIGVVLQSKLRFNGSEMVLHFDPWVLLPNGFSTSCPEWDPRRTPVTRADFAAGGLDCEVRPWRKAGAGFQVQDSDGDWGQILESSPVYRSAAAKRVDYALVSTSSFSTVGLGFYGMEGLLAINADALQLRGDGTFVLGQSSTVWQKADAQNRREADIAGRYYIDGYLIAMADENGNTSVQPFFDVTEGGEPLVYLGPRLYGAAE